MKKISFGTDFHGNLSNIDQFLKESKDREVDHIIFGGDIAPKKMAGGLQGGFGFKVPHSLSDMAEGKMVDYFPSDELKELGYAILDGNIDRGEFEMSVGIFAKIKKRVDNKSENLGLSELGLTKEQTVFLLNNIDSLLGDFLRKTGTGKRLFSIISHSYKSLHRNKKSLTINKYIKYFRDFVLVDYLMGLSEEERMHHLFGRKVSRKKYMKVIGSFFENVQIVKLCSLRTVLSGLVKARAPWTQWEEMYDELPRYMVVPQLEFAENLVQRIAVLRGGFQGSISLILGNDDMKELDGVFAEADRAGILNNATNRVVRLDEDTQMLGYSNVLPVASARFDVWFKEEDEIGTDLKGLMGKLNREVGNTVFNFHCPPSDSSVSKAIIDGQLLDLGSAAVRSCIDLIRPAVVLCGHTHESCRITGVDRDEVSGVTVVNPGASEYQPRFYFGEINR